jgi:hypothetical protein
MGGPDVSPNTASILARRPRSARSRKPLVPVVDVLEIQATSNAAFPEKYLENALTYHWFLQE